MTTIEVMRKALEALECNNAPTKWTRDSVRQIRDTPERRGLSSLPLDWHKP